MADSFVQVPPDSTGKQIATNEIGGKEYQIVNLADENGASIAPVSNDSVLNTNAILQAIENQNQILMMIIPMLQSLGTMDSAFRQRIVVDSMPAIPSITTVTTVGNTALTAGYDLRQFHWQAEAAYNTALASNQ